MHVSILTIQLIEHVCLQQVATCPSYTNTSCVAALLQPPLQHRTSSNDFGVSVSMGAGFAAIGAPGINMAFVYQTAPLSLEAVATLQAPDAAAGDSFGKAVSVSRNGTWIAVGAPHRDEGGSADKGAVYIFSFVQGQWTYHSKITSNLAVANDRFGWSVSVDDSLGKVIVLVGCNYRVDYSGFVEVFELQSLGKLTQHTRNALPFAFAMVADPQLKPKTVLEKTGCALRTVEQG
jgi:hypothetical protein